MKTKEDIENKIIELQEYLKEHHNSSRELAVKYLKAILNSTPEEIEKYYNYIDKKVSPVKTFEQRKILKEKAEEFYNKNLKGKIEIQKNILNYSNNMTKCNQ